MANHHLRLDHSGLGAILRSTEVRAATNAAAASVVGAAHPHASGAGSLPVTLKDKLIYSSRLSPRIAYDVTIAHPAGRAVEARRGTLINAARAVGLEVHGGNAEDPNDLVDYVTRAGIHRQATRAQVAHWTRGH